MSKKRGKRRGTQGLRTLSKSPENPWPEGAVHHGARIGLLVVLALAITLMFPPAPRPGVSSYALGEVAREDVSARIPFDVPKTDEELERDQQVFEATIPPTFQFHPEVVDSVEDRVDRFFSRLGMVVDSGGLPSVEEALRAESILVRPGQAEPLLDPGDRQALQEALQDAIRQLMPRYLDASDEQYLTSGDIVQTDQTGLNRQISADSLLVGQEFFTLALGRLQPFAPEVENLFRLFGFRFFQSPYSLDPVATELGKTQARQAVQRIKDRVVAGQIIIRDGDLIGEAELQRLTAYETALRGQDLIQEEGLDRVSLLGTGILNLLLLSIFGLLLFFYRREVYEKYRWVLLLAFLVVVYFLAGAVVSWQGFPSELLPIAFAVLPVAILWDGRMALILALLLGVLTGAQGPFDDFGILAVTLIGGAAAALSARAVRRRAQTWIFIALISLAYGIGIFALGLMDKTEPTDVLVSVLLASFNATVSAILAMGFVPVFEWFTGITTDQTLLEWADPNRPLLKRLSLEASGTYAHTINVANLAEAAATAIGANGLLCRVGIYYHDVGKMLKPHFFVENQPGGRNPHDKLKPQLSATIVREHVVEGERLAREEGVPAVVTRFIPEHHGTQLIGFFFEKAKEESGEELDEEGFRYPGPKPRSKETAIAMLADSVESATRALQDPSPERVMDLVRTIVDGKIRDGQLTDSPLTLREIALIQEQFAKVIGGMYHHRLDYPATKHLTDSPLNGEAGSRQAGSAEGETAEPPLGPGPGRERGPETDPPDSLE
ncbi:HD family phosphohydrolase [Gemmatimonadota bacterium]